MLYAMADNGVNIPAARDGALYSFLTGGQDYIFKGIGDEFEITVSSSSYIVTLTEGEGICGGRHIREVTENSANSTIQLSANASGYVTIRIDLSRPSGTECYLCDALTLVSQDLNDTGTVRDLPLYKYTTDGSGISSWVDLRHVSSGSNVVNVIRNGMCYVQYYENDVLKTKQIGTLDPSVLTATPGDVKSGKTFGGADSDEPQTGTFGGQSKTASPTTAAQTISPDNGKYLSSVVVKGIGMKANTNKATYSHSGSVVVDLGASKQLISIAFGGVTGDGSFSLQPSYSLNNSTYTNIGGAVSGNPTGTVRNTAVSARYVKVTYDGADQIQNSLWCSVVYVL